MRISTPVRKVISKRPSDLQVPAPPVASAFRCFFPAKLARIPRHEAGIEQMQNRMLDTANIKIDASDIVSIPRPHQVARSFSSDWFRGGEIAEIIPTSAHPRRPGPATLKKRQMPDRHIRVDGKQQLAKTPALMPPS